MVIVFDMVSCHTHTHTCSVSVAWESTVCRVRMLEESAMIQMLHSSPPHDLTIAMLDIVGKDTYSLSIYI